MVLCVFTLTSTACTFLFHIMLSCLFASLKVSNVRDMEETFKDAKSFNQDLSAWDGPSACFAILGSCLRHCLLSRFSPVSNCFFIPSADPHTFLNDSSIQCTVYKKDFPQGRILRSVLRMEYRKLNTERRTNHSIHG